MAEPRRGRFPVVMRLPSSPVVLRHSHGPVRAVGEANAFCPHPTGPGRKTGPGAAGASRVRPRGDARQTARRRERALPREGVSSRCRTLNGRVTILTIVPMTALSAALMRRMEFSFESSYAAVYPHMAFYTGFAPTITVAWNSSETG